MIERLRINNAVNQTIFILHLQSCDLTNYETKRPIH